jgi:hypothetical protein
MQIYQIIGTFRIIIFYYSLSVVLQNGIPYITNIVIISYIYSHELNTQQCIQNVQHQVNSYAQSMSQGIKSSTSPRTSLDSRILDIEKQQHQQHMIHSLSTSSGGYVCSTSSDSTKHNPLLQQHQARVLTPSETRMECLSRLTSVPIEDDSFPSKPTNTLVTARKSSHKLSTTTEPSQQSFKATTLPRKITDPICTDVLSPIAASLDTTIDPTLLMTKAKYNRRNNPDLEKRRIHFCDHPGNF